MRETRRAMKRKRVEMRCRQKCNIGKGERTETAKYERPEAEILVIARDNRRWKLWNNEAIGNPVSMSSS